MTDTLANDIEVIAATRDAWPFILDSFRSSLIRNGELHALAFAYSAGLSRMLHQSAAHALLAVPIGHLDDYAGWLVHANGSVLYAYVRKPLRRNGIATKLIGSFTESAPVGLAFWPPKAQAIADHGFPICYDEKAFELVLAFCRTGNHPQRRQAHGIQERSFRAP